jgi:hypothetical protein
VPAAAEQALEFIAFSLAEFDPIAYVRPCLLLIGGTDEKLNRMAGVLSAKTFTPEQGQYLAYIHLYTRARIAGRPQRLTSSNIFESHHLQFTK